ncbi:hypothetical protein [Entomohabitans teleogrylli]|uniref:hypothetical protein n=1 Tax=Entomohabitans teleogrylli TaxID=1384589 RepID=UPI00073DA718|nr:hypothetical protein [Entomohabitans teleogrylli]
MKYHFISDDVFFLHGISATLENSAVHSRLINLNNDADIDFHPAPGDLVVLAVSNHLTRKAFLQMPVLQCCRLVVMMDLPMKKTSTLQFPCLLSKSISGEELIHLVNTAENIPVRRGNVSQRVLDVFNQLGRGGSAHRLAVTSSTSLKLIYRIKRSVFQEYGLLNCNSQGILVCRDMLRMKMPV